MAAYSWESPFDESNHDLPVDEAVDVLIKFKQHEELTFDEEGLVRAAFIFRPDLLQEAGFEVKEVTHAA